MSTFGSRSARIGLGLVALLGCWVGLPAPMAQADPAAPKPIARANPEYPRSALRNGIEGSVLVQFGIDAYGHVVAPRVIDASPRGVFDRAAIAAVSRWRYQASDRATQDVKIRLTFRRGDRPAYARTQEIQRAANETRSASSVLPVSGPAYPISGDAR